MTKTATGYELKIGHVKNSCLITSGNQCLINNLARKHSNDKCHFSYASRKNIPFLYSYIKLKKKHMLVTFGN